MQASSAKVTSSQTGPHQNLLTVVRRQREMVFAKPIASHTRAVFEQVAVIVHSVRDRLIILDAGCGTGESTEHLAAARPDAWVIGVDRSAHRLARFGINEGPAVRDNLIIARAELVDYLQLAAAASWRFEKIYLLYPNPYPKPGQLQRRWHAHGIFPTMLGLAAALELRTNWCLYAEELVIALAEFGIESAVETLQIMTALTPFERKYAASDHPLFTVCAVVSDAGV